MLAQPTPNKFSFPFLKGEIYNYHHFEDDFELRLIFALLLHRALKDGLPAGWVRRRLKLWILDAEQIPSVRKIKEIGGVEPLIKLWLEWQEITRNILRALREKNPRRLNSLASAIKRDKTTTLQAVRDLQRRGLVTYEEWPWKVVRLTEKGKRKVRLL
jgi:hypothetical protein